MESSTWMVYSVIRNIFTFVQKEKDVNLFKKVNYFHFQNAPKFFIENAKRIYSEIENGYYTYHELAIFLMYQYMMDGKIYLYGAKQKVVQEAMKLFTVKRLNEDLKLLKQIHKELKFKKGLKDYFEMKEDGTNIAYILTKKRRISPIFFIRNFDNPLTNQNENVIIDINSEYKQFQKIAKKIKETLKGGSLDE